MEKLTTLGDFPYDKSKATKENIGYYNSMLNCIKSIESEETVSSTDVSQLGLLVCYEVNFINTLRKDLKRIPLNAIKMRFNMMKTVIKHMSDLSYKELLRMYPVPINFDGEACTFCYSNIMDNFMGKTYETLGECGINIDEIDIDNAIGENIHNFVSSNDNAALWKFYRTFHGTAELLLKRDIELRKKYSYTDLANDLDLFLEII